MVDLTTDATLNGDSITVTVEDDLGNTDTVSIADGASTVTLSTIDPSASQVRAQDIEWAGTAQLHGITITAEPTPPQNLTATAANADQVDLSWDPPSDWGGDTGGYNIYRGQSSGSYAQIDSVGSGTTTYSDAPLEAGERYYYVVRAYNSAGESDNSNEADATTSLPAATIDSLDNPTEDEITVNWTKNDDSSDGSWEIYRSTDGTMGSQVYSSTTLSTTSFTDTGLTDGQQYYYTVRRNTDHTSADVQASQTTLLPAPTIDSLDSSTEDEITVSWTLNDDSSDGDVHVYRSMSSGTLGSDISGSLSLSTTSLTDTGLADGERYYYTVRRETTDATSDSAQQAATTVLPAPTNLASPGHGSTSVDLTWTANHDNGDTEVQYKRTSSGSWSTFSTVARTTEAETVTGLRTGERYDFRVRSATSHDTAASGTIQTTTDLPDVGQPSLGNGVEDEIAVSWSDVINYGEYDIEYRETGASTWLTGPTVGEATTSSQITGLEDGEEYEVRLRTQTEHVTGSWTTPASIVTQFPGVSGLAVGTVTKTSVDLSWTDNADNEDGFDVERAKIYDSGLGPWRTIDTLSANTTAYTDTSPQPGREYHYRIRGFTEHTDAASNAVTATTTASGVNQRRVPARGWRVEVEHPNLDAPKRAVTLDDPQWLPTLNGRPECRIPVPYDETWDSTNWERAPMRVWQDGTELEIDELHAVEHETSSSTKRTVLVGRGGSELRDRVQAEYDNKEAHLAAKELVENNTPYTANVDDPADGSTETPMQSASSTDDFESAIEALPGDSDPWEISNGTVDTLQTCFPQEGESEIVTVDTGGHYTDGVAGVYSEPGDTATYSFTLDHDIPAGDFVTHARIQTSNPNTGNASPPLTITLDKGTANETVLRDSVSFGFASISWTDLHSAPGQDLAAGSHSVTIEVEWDESSTSETFTSSHGTWVDLNNDRILTNSETVTGEDESGNTNVTFTRGTDYEMDYSAGEIKTLSAGSMKDSTSYDISYDYEFKSDGIFYLDVIAPLDEGTRYNWGPIPYTFDNDNGGSGGHLDGPQEKPIVYVPFATVGAARSVVGGRVEAVLDDTSDGQALELSNDDGSNYNTGPNTDSFTTSFGSGGGSLKFRAVLGRYGTRTGQTPKTGFRGQTLDSFETFAEVEETPILTSKVFDGQLIDVLQEIAQFGQFIFEIRRQSDGSTSVEWTQPGQRETSADPAILDYRTRKENTRYRKAVIYGASRPVSNDRFDANHGTAQSLTNQEIVEGKLTVYDPSDGTQFVEDEDYTVNYSDGKVTTLSSGSMTDGATYAADYSQRPVGEFEAGDFDASKHDTLVETIPTASSNRECEQAALYLVDELGTPRLSASVTLSRLGAGQSLVDDLALDQLPLSDGVRTEDITQGPEQVQLEMGSRARLGDAIQRVQERLGATERKI